VNSSLPTLYLDLNRLRDYALGPEDLQPLMASLADDLQAELRALEAALKTPPAGGEVLHRHLHALKGMSGMFAGSDLLARLTDADDACRRSDMPQGLPLVHALLPDLNAWLDEVKAWLQRYS
jgi:HPt (histidine-containing phosphotransfer) domain-containing protein